MTVITNKNGDIMQVTSKEHFNALIAKQKMYQANLAQAKYMPKSIVKYYSKALLSVTKEIEQIGVVK